MRFGVNGLRQYTLSRYYGGHKIVANGGQIPCHGNCRDVETMTLISQQLFYWYEQRNRCTNVKNICKRQSITI